MSATDAKTQKALSELGLRSEAPLTPEQEQILQRALDPEKQYLYDVEQLFTNTKDK